jgi:hypothetical protein
MSDNEVSGIDCAAVSTKLTQILSTSKSGMVDAEAINEVMGQFRGQDYLKLAEFSFEKYLEKKDESYKQIFGIAVTYARVTPGVKQSEWQNLSDAMKTISEKKGFEWQNLSKAIEGVAKGAASMKTMVFTIINRSLMNDAVKKLQIGLGTQPTPSSLGKVSGRVRQV